MADNDSRNGSSYATRAILEFIHRTHGPHDNALARAFAVPEGVPSHQVSHDDGRLLHVLLRLAKAKKVVEVGALAGYSAIHIARALEPGGHLWSIEFEPKHAKLARDNVAAAGLADRVTIVEGAALDMLPTLVQHGPFDAVFIDGDKPNYDRYGRWALENVRVGGLILGDNAYLFGELMEDRDDARAMRAFNELIAKTCDSVCAPTPDGMVIGIKRAPGR